MLTDTLRYCSPLQIILVTVALASLVLGSPDRNEKAEATIGRSRRSVLYGGYGLGYGLGYGGYGLGYGGYGGYGYRYPYYYKSFGYGYYPGSYYGYGWW